MNNKFCALDPMSTELAESHSPGIQHALSSLDGAVYSQGIKVSHRDWLDMGSESYAATPEPVKAAAYQAAQATGWDETQIKHLMVAQYDHLTSHMMDVALETLQGLAQEHPVTVESTKISDLDVASIKVQRYSDTDDNKAATEEEAAD